VEIDEPGYSFGIFTRIFRQEPWKTPTRSRLPLIPMERTSPWPWVGNIILAADETALIRFLLGGTAPTGGFFLSQYDPDSLSGVYFSTDITIRGGEFPVPEPSTLILLETVWRGGLVRPEALREEMTGRIL